MSRQRFQNYDLPRLGKKKKKKNLSNTVAQCADAVAKNAAVPTTRKHVAIGRPGRTVWAAKVATKFPRPNAEMQTTGRETFGEENRANWEKYSHWKNRNSEARLTDSNLRAAYRRVFGFWLWPR